MMPAVVFTTLGQWTAFHDAICADLGIPRPGKRQSDGKVALNAQWTTAAYTPAVVQVLVNGNPRKVGILRGVPQAVVTKYALTTITDPTPNTDAKGQRDGTWTVTVNGNEYKVALAADGTQFPYAKAKPSQWTDPSDGRIYQVT